MQEGGTGAGRGQSEGVENEMDMQEGVTGVKRGEIRVRRKPMQRQREGIKRGLWNNAPVSYEEYDDSWDLEDQSKKC